MFYLRRNLAISPWCQVDRRRGRLDLRVDLTKVENGKQAYWHDVLWFFFHNDGQFETFSEFRKTFRAKKGYRVDHMGGLPNETNVLRLQLQAAGESVKQGGQRRRALTLSGEGALLQRRLLKHYAHRRLLKRPAQNMNGFAYSRQPPKVTKDHDFKTAGPRRKLKSQLVIEHIGVDI